MQRSAGERVQGTAPEREAEMDRDGNKRKTEERGGETTSAARKDGSDKHREKPTRALAEGTLNFT